MCDRYVLPDEILDSTTFRSAHAVSPRINSRSPDDAGLIEPAEP
jgi:hypothetical protein